MTLKLPEGATLEPINPTGIALPEGATLQPQTSMLREGRRQLGLTGRYLAEGAGSIFDLLASPVRSGLNVALPENMQIPEMSIGKYASDVVGLPEPKTGLERVVGEASRGLTSVGTTGGLGALFRPQSVTGGAIKKAFTESMPTQLVAGSGAGATSQLAEEAGAGTGGQLLAGLAGGLSAPSIARKLQKPTSSINKTISNVINKSNSPVEVNQAVDNVLENTLKNNNIKFSELTDDVISTVREDIKNATKVNPKVSNDALKRLVDYRITGATPKQGTITLDPAKITQEKNLAKLGANSQDPNAQRLSQIEAENNAILVRNMNELGAKNAVEPQQASAILYNKFQNIADNNKQIISDLYNKVKDNQGRFAKFDSNTFVSKTRKDLIDQAEELNVPAYFTQRIKQIEDGVFDLNVSTSAQLKSQAAKILRSDADGNTKKAVSIIRQNLDDATLLPNQGLGKEALEAEKAARKYTYQYKQLEDSVPALKYIADKKSIDTFFNKNILNVDTAQLKRTLEQSDNATRRVIKNNVLGHLKSKATNNAPDEVALISGANLDKALKSLGTDKLKLLFNKKEIAQLKAVANVSRYEQFIPRGAAVNVSNTASGLYNILERAGQSALLGKIPLGRSLVGEPAQNIVLSNQARQAQDVSKSLGLASELPTTKTRSLLSPYTVPLMSEEEIPTINIVGGQYPR